MATLQVSLPVELHAEIRRRAAQKGLTLSEFVTRLVRRGLRRPPLNDWLDRLSARPLQDEVDVVALLDELRDQA